MNAFVKIGLGVAGGIVACWALKRSGMDKKVISAVNTVGAKTTSAAITAISATVDVGAKAGDLTIEAAKATVKVASSGVEAAGYGLGRGARFVLDATNKVGDPVGNPLSRGVARGFYAPEAAAVEKTYDVVNGVLATA
jgi:hypothetical protein